MSWQELWRVVEPWTLSSLGKELVEPAGEPAADKRPLANGHRHTRLHLRHSRRKIEAAWKCNTGQPEDQKSIAQIPGQIHKLGLAPQIKQQNTAFLARRHNFVQLSTMTHPNAANFVSSSRKRP